MNLLESVLFHRTAIDAADDYLLELVDFCYRYIQRLVSGKIKFVDPPTDPHALAEQSREQEFDRQRAGIEFNIAFSAISIIRYISDQAKHVQPAVLRHLHLENDMLMACVVLIEERPWLRSNKEGKRERFEDGKWSQFIPLAASTQALALNMETSHSGPRDEKSVARVLEVGFRANGLVATSARDKGGGSAISQTEDLRGVFIVGG